MIAGVSGALLAGGASRRMGTDKASLRWRGDTLGGHAAQVLLSLFDDVLVVERSGECRAIWPDDVRLVCDPPDSVPCALTGIATALAAAHSPWVFVMACDMPAPNAGLISELCHRAVEGSARGQVLIPRDGTRAHPLHAVYPRTLGSVIMAALANGERRVQDVLAPHARFIDRPEWSPWDPGGRGLHNLNTPAEFESAGGHPLGEI